MQELYDAYQEKTLEEAFGTGTAAVISPIGELNWNGMSIKIGQGIGEVSLKVYDTLTGIQTGRLDDIFNWTVEVI
jgi:branched-chain amino acid aminotransferase